MTRDDIIKLAREAGFITGETHASTGFHHPFVHPVVFASCLPELERFAALIAAAEREACAVTAWSAGMDCHNKALGLPCDARNVGSLAASAIRARSQA